MRQKKEKGGFLSMLLGTLGVSFLGNLLKGKGVRAKRQGRRVVRAEYSVKIVGSEF